MKHMRNRNKVNKITAFLGLAAVLIFIIALVLFGSLHPDFHFLNDVVSKLGAKGEPNAIGWNLIGFCLTGMLLLGFGWRYGKLIGDRLAGTLLGGFGLGFALTAIPIDLYASDSAVSKAHIVAIYLAVAAWLFGLARISSHQQLAKRIRMRANVAAVLIVAAIVGVSVQLWSVPLSHRLVFLVVFGWTVFSAIDLLTQKAIA